MSDSDFEAWLDEATEKHWKEASVIGMSIRDAAKYDYSMGARAAWAKAQEEIKEECYRSGAIEANRDRRYQKQLETLKQQAEKLVEALEALRGLKMSPGAETIIERALKEYKGE